MGHQRLCGVCDVGAGIVGSGQGLGQDEFQKCRENPCSDRGRRIVPLGGDPDGVKKCRERQWLSGGRGASCCLWVCSVGADDGGNRVCHPDRCCDRHAFGPAGRAQRRKVFRSIFQEPQHQLAQRCAAVSVRGAGRVVCRWHPDLFLRGAVGWQRRGQPGGVLHDRGVHGGMDHLLWDRPRLGTAHPESGIADRCANSGAGQTMGRCADHCAGVTRRSGLARPRAVPCVDDRHRPWPLGLWRHLRGELIPAFLSDPQLH